MVVSLDKVDGVEIIPVESVRGQKCVKSLNQLLVISFVSEFGGGVCVCVCVCSIVGLVLWLIWNNGQAR